MNLKSPKSTIASPVSQKSNVTNPSNALRVKAGVKAGYYFNDRISRKR